jgi:hypothetical protein
MTMLKQVTGSDSESLVVGKPLVVKGGAGCSRIRGRVADVRRPLSRLIT